MPFNLQILSMALVCVISHPNAYTVSVGYMMIPPPRRHSEIWKTVESDIFFSLILKSTG